MQTSDRDTETRLRSLEVALAEAKSELKGEIQALSVKVDERSNSFDKRLDGLDRKFWAILILLIGQLLALLVALIKLFVGF